VLQGAGDQTSRNQWVTEQYKSSLPAHGFVREVWITEGWHAELHQSVTIYVIATCKRDLSHVPRTRNQTHRRLASAAP
jgi:hypothetical protein